MIAEHAGPLIDSDGVTFRLADAARVWTAVQLLQHVQRPRAGPRLAGTEGGWTLRLPRPPVDRMEYRFEVQHRDGGWEGCCDPGNPLRAQGPFGETSVIEFPGYTAPAWLDHDDPPASQQLELPLPSRPLGGTLPLRLWTSAGGEVDDTRPLLLAHDGPELADYASLLRFCAAMVADGRLPPHRVALLGPVDRDRTYSASSLYARALGSEVLPLLVWMAPTPDGRPPVGLGASLGGLAMLHAHRTHPALLGGLFLQSASTFRRDDEHETGFSEYQRVSTFVQGVLVGKRTPQRRVPVTMTCGTVEENLGGNVAVAGALQRQGYDAALHVVRDAHHWRAWRDAWDPHLVDLLARSWEGAEGGTSRAGRMSQTGPS